MSDFDERFEDDYDSRDENETPEETVERLRDEIAEGEIHLKPELAEALMHAARSTAEQENYEEALKKVDEAIALGGELVEDGQLEFEASIGRCLLFRAALIRLHRGSEPALIAFNEAIRHFSEHPEIDDPDSRNELAVALVNKAELLIDPLGAHSAAIAAQEQAIRIWQQLVDDGEGRYRRPLAAVLLNCGDAKLHSGDPEKALHDYRQAAQVAREASGEDGNDFRGIVIQALMKQTRLYEVVGDIPHAFEISTETIRLTEELIAEDSDTEAPLVLTSLYLQHGLLYEKIGDSRSALELFDRCRDVYLRALEGDPLGELGDYIVRTGLANIMMCRGNMLADQERYDEAAEAFDESVRLYRESEAYRPRNDDDDDTFIPYSIAVVRLNHANMLASQRKLDEAVALKEESLDALRQRYEKGHEEILPNLISAYRKMIGIHRVLKDKEKTSHWIGQLIRLIDSAVDEGHLEYRNDLGVAYHMQSVFHEEQGDPTAAEKSLIRAVNLFRQLADEASDSQEVQMAKLQWGELLERLALLYTRQKRIDDAIDMFRKAVDDVRMLYGEGARHMIFDILLAYSQWLVFVDSILREINENPNGEDPEDLARWGRIGLDAAEAAAELSQRQRVQLGDDISTSMFFTMKLAFFRQLRGSLFFSQKENEKAGKEYSLAIDYWRSLLEDLKHLRNRRKYFEKEAGIEQEPDGDATEDPYRDRYLYYVGELRASLNRRAQCRMAQKEFDAAEEDFENDTELARELLQNGIPDADRFLVLSLTSHARGTEDSAPFDKVAGLYEEARTLIRSRFRRGEFVDDDFFMLRHIHVSFALFMLKNERVEQSIELIRDYSSELETVQKFPEPGLWIELCKALEIHAFWHLDADRVREVHQRQRGFLARHPDFETNTELQEYNAVLLEKIEHPEVPKRKDDEPSEEVFP